MIILQEFQKNCLTQILDFMKSIKPNAKKGFLLNLSPGMGKTIVILSSVKEFLSETQKSLNVCLIVPKHLKSQWRLDVSKVFECDKPKENKFQLDFEDDLNILFYIHGYEKLRFDKKEKLYFPKKTLSTMYIIDESHLLKNPKSEYFKMIQSFIKESKDTDFFFFLTGTAIVNDAQDIDCMNDFLEKKIFMSWDDLPKEQKPDVEHKIIELKMDSKMKKSISLFKQN